MRPILTELLARRTNKPRPAKEYCPAAAGRGADRLFDSPRGDELTDQLIDLGGERVPSDQRMDLSSG